MPASFNAGRKTRRTKFFASRGVCDLLEDRGIQDQARVNPVLIAGYVEKLTEERSKPTVKQHLAAIRMLLDYLVTGGILPFKPGELRPWTKTLREAREDPCPTRGRGRAAP